MWHKLLTLLYSSMVVGLGMGLIVVVFKTIDNKGKYIFAPFKTDFLVIIGCLLIVSALLYFVMSF